MMRDRLPARLREELQEDPDIVVLIARRFLALAPSVDPNVAAQVVAEIRSAYGGLRVRIPKRGKHLNAQEREALFEDGLTTMETEEILNKHKISRRTLERQMKRGGRFDRS